MDTYPLSEYQLVFSDDYETLKVQNLAEGTIDATYDLTDIDPPVFLDVFEEEYRIHRDRACTTCFRLLIDVSGDGYFTIEGAIAGGLGILDIRDIGKPFQGYDFMLESCGINLSHDGSGQFAFLVETPDNEGVCYEEVSE
ncbi:MAG: hypothetical protein H6581_21350 [Bacteroidia bacterium]|nr:hypothetical protein [Bacteroidia bacterium]